MDSTRYNVGRLASGFPALVPCTPMGCVRLAKTVHPSLAGLEAVVIGRSNIVGKPMAQLLLAENATVTIAHSKTVDLAAVCRRADLLVAAIGRPELVRGDWIKPGATVIDVGINRVPGDGGKSRIVGDVEFRRSIENRWRDYAGSGRRWPDDNRMLAAEYAARRMCAEGVTGTQSLTRPARRRRLYRASCCQSVPRNARPRGRRVHDRIPSPVRCPTAPTRPCSSGRSG